MNAKSFKGRGHFLNYQKLGGKMLAVESAIAMG